MSTLAIILILAAILLVLFVAGGILGARKRDRAVAPCYSEHLASADQALEQARAGDRGWDPALLHAAAHEALASSHPGVQFVEVRLILVDDRPGVVDDIAHFEAVREGEVARVVLTRSDAGWRGETVT
jgi:hypothetical protein